MSIMFGMHAVNKWVLDALGMDGSENRDKREVSVLLLLWYL